jgi:hypothetical protein
MIAVREPDAVQAALPEQLLSDADHVALSRLVAEISWRIDHGKADTVWELFVPDGVLDTGGTPLAGHQAIREWGRSGGARLSRRSWAKTPTNSSAPTLAGASYRVPSRPCSPDIAADSPGKDLATTPTSDVVVLI